MSANADTVSVSMAARQYVESGFILIPYDKGKGPTHRGWNKRENCISTTKQAINLYGNVGVALLYSRLVSLDADDIERARVWFWAAGIDFDAYWNAPNAVRITSGRPNRGKILYRMPAHIAILVTRMFNSDGVELRCATASGLTVQDVLPPSVHPLTGNPYRWDGPGTWRDIPEMPADLLELWLRLSEQKTTGHGNTTPAGIGREDLEDSVYKIIAATLSYIEWLHVGMALHHETSGDEVGLDIWDAWSQTGGEKYKGRGELESKWPGFRLDHERPRTLRSILYLAGKVDMSGEYESVPDEPAGAESADGEPVAPKGGVLRGPATSYVGKGPLAGPWSEPPVIVDGYMLQDSGSLVSPGGFGKTTFALLEAIHIIVGRPLWGRQIIKPGRALFITAEDSRELLISRANRICAALALTDAEYDCVGDGLCIEDVSEINARLLGSVPGGAIRTTKVAAEIIEKYAGQNLSYLHLDPVSLLGPGELSGNDGMAEVQRLGRRFSRALGCAVRWIHHTGQTVARQVIRDQYAGRGGTAFADNARFVHQLDYARDRRFTFDGINYAIPACVTERDIKSGNVLMLMVLKISYQARNKTPILVLRNGFRFTQIELGFDTPESARESARDQVNRQIESICGFLETNLANGVKLNATRLDELTDDVGLKRGPLRSALATALATGRIVDTALPPAERKGCRKTYLLPVDAQNEAL